MKHSRRSRKSGVAILLVVLALMPPSLLARQQQRPEKQPVDPAANPRFRAMVESMSQRARELGLISVTEDEDQAAFVRRRRDAQLSEDFSKLYSINAEKIVPQWTAASLDFKLLFDATGDLKNRASRIKNSVVLLQLVDKGEKIQYEERSDRLAPMLAELSGLIDSFLGSPIFRLSSPNDAALRLKASRDLDCIIKLSDTLNKIVKRSIKAAP